jgi:SAM-dependent methyltransferase
MNNIGKLCLLLIVILLFLNISSVFMPQVETLVTRRDKYELYDNESLYDTFYAEVYDQLLFSPIKNSYEINELNNSIKIKQLLDIGCGTGHHCGVLATQGIQCIGLDKSPAMIKQAKELFPPNEFVEGDANVAMSFQGSQFDTILIMYFTAYYFKEKSVLFQNCYHWLQPGGHLVIHLVDKDMFDPIVPSGNPIDVVSVQDFAKKRISRSRVAFKEFDYVANYGDGGFKEKFTFKDGKVRENHHTLYMETQPKILSYAKAIGFIMIKKINLYECDYKNQYLYVLQKPN